MATTPPTTTTTPPVPPAATSSTPNSSASTPPPPTGAAPAVGAVPPVTTNTVTEAITKRNKEEAEKKKKEEENKTFAQRWEDADLGDRMKLIVAFPFAVLSSLLEGIKNFFTRRTAVSPDMYDRLKIVDQQLEESNKKVAELEKNNEELKSKPAVAPPAMGFTSGAMPAPSSVSWAPGMAAAAPMAGAVPSVTGAGAVPMPVGGSIDLRDILTKIDPNLAASPMMQDLIDEQNKLLNEDLATMGHASEVNKSMLPEGDISKAIASSIKSNKPFNLAQYVEANYGQSAQQAIAALMGDSIMDQVSAHATTFLASGSPEAADELNKEIEIASVKSLCGFSLKEKGTLMEAASDFIKQSGSAINDNEQNRELEVQRLIENLPDIPADLDLEPEIVAAVGQHLIDNHSQTIANYMSVEEGMDHLIDASDNRLVLSDTRTQASGMGMAKTGLQESHSMIAGASYSIHQSDDDSEQQKQTVAPAAPSMG